jgi:hypothetical protein
METAKNGMVTFEFVKPTSRRKGLISVEIKPVDFKYPALNELHNQVIQYIKNPVNKFQKIGRDTRSTTRDGTEKYVRIINNTEEDIEFLENFKNTMYDLPAAASFIKSLDDSIKDDFVNHLISEIEKMSLGSRGGKRRTRRGKKSRKSKRKHSRKYRR